MLLSIVNYGVSKHYAGSQVSDRCPLGYLFYSSSDFLTYHSKAVLFVDPFCFLWFTFVFVILSFMFHTGL